MTISEINTYVSFRANTDTTQYTAANRLIAANRWYHKIQTMILDSMDEWDYDDLNFSTEATVSKNLTANQGYVQLGTSDKILKVKRAEFQMDGTNWYKGEPIDQGEISSSINTQTEINNTFTLSKPYYDQRGLYVYIYPVPTVSVTNGAKFWVSREVDEFTSGQVTTGTKEPGFDEAFHIMIPLGMTFDWCSAKGGSSAVLAALKNDVEKELADYELRLRKHYGRKNEDRHLQLKSAFTNYA